MSTETGRKLPVSLWASLMRRLRLPWILLGISLLLIAAPLVAAYLDGHVEALFRECAWRLILSPAAVIIHILVVIPVVERADIAVLNAFRPLAPVDDDDFDWQGSCTILV